MKNISGTSKKHIFLGILITLVAISNTEATEDNQSSTMQDEVGRYQLETIVTGLDRNRIWSWVIDTKTGRVRLCIKSKSANPPSCGAWSTE